MSVPKYGVLVGKPSDRRLATPKKNHYEIRIEAAGQSYRVAFNVQSVDGSEVLYAVHDPFVHPLTAALGGMADGHQLLASQPGGAAIDFIRGAFVTQAEMKPIPLTAPGTDNDLNDILDRLVMRAIDGGGTIYAFGSFFRDNKSDPYFNFKPGQGIHDVHMNQGNSKQFQGDDGVWQDGALVFRTANGFAAIFIAFQNQSWQTDAQGHATAVAPAPGPTPPVQPPLPVPPPSTPSIEIVRIVAAMANSIQDPEQETVTLLNASPGEVDLSGWVLKDRNQNRLTLAGKVASGEAVRIPIAAPVQLSNKGGSITLVDSNGKIVDGVAYTKEQASKAGWSIVF